MGNENPIGGSDESEQLGGNSVMNDRTSGRQGAGVRQTEESGSGRSQQGGTTNDEEEDSGEKKSSPGQR